MSNVPSTTQHATPTLDPTRTYSAAEVQDLLSRVRISGSEKSVMSVADVKLQYQKIGANISPHLLSNGSNFSQWSEALSIEVASLFEHSQYFESANVNASAEQASLMATILQFSIHQDLVPLVQDKVGRKAFKILKEPFDKTSWTYVMTRWVSLTLINVLHKPDKAYNNVSTTLWDIEKRLGTISIDVLAAFILHQNSQHRFHKILNALEARLAVNPHLCFGSKDILELLGQYKTNENQQQNAVLAISATTGGQPPPTGVVSIYRHGLGTASRLRAQHWGQAGSALGYAECSTAAAAGSAAAAVWLRTWWTGRAQH